MACKRSAVRFRLAPPNTLSVLICSWFSDILTFFQWLVVETVAQRHLFALFIEQKTRSVCRGLYISNESAIVVWQIHTKRLVLWRMSAGFYSQSPAKVAFDRNGIEI